MSETRFTHEWIPYLVDQDGKRTRLFLPDKYYTRAQMQRFFATIPKTSPLYGKRIDFEETPLDAPVRVIVPVGFTVYGSKGD